MDNRTTGFGHMGNYLPKGDTIEVSAPLGGIVVAIEQLVGTIQDVTPL